MTDIKDPDPLDLARREWLAGLQHAHADAPGAETALALARGAWQCGEYDLALTGFQQAHAAAPGNGETTLALVRAAAMLARFDIEAATLDAARSHRVESAPLSLHRALKCVPEAIGRARQLLSAHPDNVLCAQFDVALAAIEAADPQRLPNRTDPRVRAMDDSLRWAMRHARSVHAHVGLPVDVLIRALDTASPDGLVLECGVYFGRSLRIIASRTQSPVHGFDSFEGLPESWNPAEGAGAYSTAGRKPAMPPHVSLHAGWFEQTLPPFFAAHPEPIRLLHVDCDLCSSTRTVLEHARPRLVRGSVVVFDDLLGYPGYEAHELRAWNEFTTAHGVRWELLAASLLGREVAVRIV